MKNPWTNKSLFSAPRSYSKYKTYAMKWDCNRIQAFNNCTKNKDQKIILNILPEPYIGSLTATYILLLLNPGYSKFDDERFYSDKSAFNLWRKNLYQIIVDNPFYLLNDELIHLNGGPNWWRKTFNKLNRDGIEYSQISKNFLSLEFFPYHSKSFNYFPITLLSQEFIFEFLKQRINNPKKNQKIILMRGKKYWETAVPELVGYTNYIKSKVARRSYITPKMIGVKKYNQILNELKNQD